MQAPTNAKADPISDPTPAAPEITTETALAEYSQALYAYTLALLRQLNVKRAEEREGKDSVKQSGRQRASSQV